MSEQFTNARVHIHLTPALDTTAEQMHTTRLLLNSAALHYFLEKLTPKERAEALGEYVKVLAMHGQGGQQGRSGKEKQRKGPKK
jgi:hypothetical protein